MSARAQLYLIDGSSQMYRAYHAIRGLTGPDGRSTNAVYGFVTMLRKLLTDHRPDYIGAAFDLPKPTFRSGLSADYKANRAPMPPDLVEQVAHVHEACEALGVPIITYDGFEADDVIGTLARQAAEQGIQVALVTGDKDFFQLVTEQVLVFNPRDEGFWYDADGVRTKFGVSPSQVIDVLALMGDTSDNVKGVPGIGEKGARDLIAAHGSLDTLLARASELTQKKYREALLAHADAARQSRELVRLRTDVPVTLEMERLRYQGAHRERCFDLFSRLGFRTLVTEFAPTAANIESSYQTVVSRDQLDALAAALRAAGRFGFHVLLDRDEVLDARPLGIAFSIEAKRAWWVPLATAAPDSCEQIAPVGAGAPGGSETRAGTAEAGGSGPGQGNLFGIAGHESAAAEPEQLSAGAGWPHAIVREVLGPVLVDRSVARATHDVKRVAIALEPLGMTLEGMVDDTMLASYVLDATRSTHTLESLALDELAYRATDQETLCGKGVKAVGFDAVPPDAVRSYTSERADLVTQLAPMLLDRLEETHLTAVYRDLELPLVPVLAAIEQRGIAVDSSVLAELGTRVQRELDTKCARIYELAGIEFNINSPKQLSEVLFDKLQLPTSRKTGKTRATSTAVEVLEELALVHEIPREILDWRGLAKLKGTYIDALPLLVRPETGRVHTTFNQAVAATGRLSSSDPNLQNIPIRTELGRGIRRAFVAAPGYSLISADYSQIELRVLAHLSSDPSLIESFTRGEDIHDRTAQKVFGTDSKLDPYELRRRAKIINYALLYGKTAFTLARDIGVSKEAAQAFIEAYFDGFPNVRRFIDDTLARAREAGVVSTMIGRRRLVPEITSRNGQVRAGAERIAVNMPIQGTAADILKRAMIDVHAALDRRPGGRDAARMILTVHDELLFEARADQAEEVAGIVRDQMEHAAQLAVPLTVDIGIGENWMEAKN
jgi:DNA polymerase-1